MVKIETLANKIFALLTGHKLELTMFDSEGMSTVDPVLARRFFSINPNIMVTINEEQGSIEISKGVVPTGETEPESGGTPAMSDTVRLQKNIRKIADEFLMNLKVTVFGKSIQPRDYAYQVQINKDKSMMEGFDQSQETKYTADKQLSRALDNTSLISPNGRSGKVVANEGYKTNSLIMAKVYQELDYAAGMTADALAANIPGSDLNDVQSALNDLVSAGKVELVGHNMYSKSRVAAISESFSKMFGSQRTSLQVLENVRILVKHRVPVDESVPGARSRHISAIFLECNGERFRFPHNYLPGARAMAQHMAHGGVISDKVGSYITESTSQLMKLQSFNRYVTTNKLINEDSSGIVETVKENIETIRAELKKLTGVKTYETIKARIETFEREPLAEDDVSGLKDLFTIRKFDEKFEEVLPIVKQLIQEKDTYHKRIEEAAGAPVKIRREAITTTPMFEFSSENARLGFKINELALRIVENTELAGFINKIGSKLCKEGQVNDFERAILTQVFENILIEDTESTTKEIKESADLSVFFDKYIPSFY